MIKKFKNYIFDFDGTIANTSILHSNAFRKTLKASNNLKFNFSYEKIKGLTTKEAFKLIGIKKNLNELTELKRKIYKCSIDNAQLYKNSKKTLKFLHKRKKKIFIVSGSQRTNILKILNNNNINFIRGIISSDNTKYSKPHKMPYKLCLNKFKLNNEKTIVIEDSASGLISAKKNNLKVVGINNKRIKNKSDFFFNNFYYLFKELKKYENS